MSARGSEQARSEEVAGTGPFLELVMRTIEKARKDDEPVCVACLGVHGTASEDHLVTIGAALSRSIRGGDVVARLDGERFGLVLHHCELEILDIVARRLGAQVPAPLAGSLGIAYFSDPPEGEQQVAAQVALNTAREALDEAMSTGGPRVVVRAR